MILMWFSQRVDPNLFHWQRVEHPTSQPNDTDHLGESGNRPPSYVSEDGVENTTHSV